MKDLKEDTNTVYCTVLDTPPTPPQRPHEQFSIGSGPLHFPRQAVITQNNNRCCRNRLWKMNVALMFAVTFFAILSTVFAVMYFTIDKKDETSGSANSSKVSNVEKCKSMNGTMEQKCNCSGSWKYLGYGCVGAKDNQYLELAYSGQSHFIGAIKLVHTNGSVGCHGTAYSNWGCWDTSARLDGSIIMTVTDFNNQVLYPSPRLFKMEDRHKGWYKLPGYNPHSPELVLTDFGNPMYLKKGEKIRIWYSEDLYDHTESDNHGKTCIHVYVFST